MRATPFFRRCRMFGYNTLRGKFRVDLSSFFEPFPIAKRRVKSGRDAFLEYYLRKCEALTTLEPQGNSLHL